VRNCEVCHQPNTDARLLANNEQSPLLLRPSWRCMMSQRRPIGGAQMWPHCSTRIPLSSRTFCGAMHAIRSRWISSRRSLLWTLL
jgi:hypothetical protein